MSLPQQPPPGPLALSVAIGPVQTFIAASRRLSDLAAGSLWVRHLARLVAGTIRARHPDAHFIVPALSQGRLPRQLTNQLLVVLPATTEGEVRSLADGIEHALRSHARTTGERLARRYSTALDDKALAWQLEDAIEFFAAWLPCSCPAKKQELDAVQRKLSSRKRTRTFQADCSSRDGRAKSSLDGLRDSVILERTQPLVRGLRLGAREHLDGLGVMRRGLGRALRQPPLSRLALQPWLDHVKRLPGGVCGLQEIEAAYEKLVEQRLATRAYGVESFCYDAELMFADRAGLDEAYSGLAQARKRVLRLVDGVGLPVPYVAMLQADGDELGRFASHHGRERTSQALHQFAHDIEPTLRASGAHLVYAGGEDLLALAPMPNALSAARAVADAFDRAFSSFEVRPSISIGVAVRHILPPLRALRRATQRALQRAKNSDALVAPRRASLAVNVAPRHGGELMACGPLALHGALPGIGAAGYERHLQWWVDVLRSGQLPMGLPYTVREGIDRAPDNPALFAARLRRQLERSDATAEVVDWLISRFELRYLRQATMDRADEVMSELLVARWLAQHQTE